jgi:hypothetical protein
LLELLSNVNTSLVLLSVESAIMSSNDMLCAVVQV